jgi:hypothetical protein
MHPASPVAAAADVTSSDTQRRTHQTAANEVIVVLCTRRQGQPSVTSRGRIQADENHSYRTYSIDDAGRGTDRTVGSAVLASRQARLADDRPNVLPRSMGVFLSYTSNSEKPQVRGILGALDSARFEGASCGLCTVLHSHLPLLLAGQRTR